MKNRRARNLLCGLLAIVVILPFATGCDWDVDVIVPGYGGGYGGPVIEIIEVYEDPYYRDDYYRDDYYRDDYYRDDYYRDDYYDDGIWLDIYVD